MDDIELFIGQGLNPGGVRASVQTNTLNAGFIIAMASLKANAELAYAQTLADQLRSELKSLKLDKTQLIDTIREERNQAHRDREEMMTRMNALSLDKEAISRELGDALYEISTLKAQLSQDRQMVEDSNSRAIMIQSEIDDLETEAQRKESDLKMRIETLQEELDSLREEAKEEKEDFDRTLQRYLHEGLPVFESTQ